MILLPMDQYSVQGMFTLICIITPYSGVVGIMILVPIRCKWHVNFYLSHCTYGSSFVMLVPTVYRAC